MATTCFDHLTDAVASAYDFSPFSTLVDVGGAEGTRLAAILRAHPGLRGVLFDRPHVAAGAEGVVAAAGLSDRCEVVGGDFFKSLPSGGAAYLLTRVIHDRDDEQALAILTNCRRAMGQRGTLLLVERVLPPADPLVPFTPLGHTMPVSTGGDERTEAAYRALLATTGFTLARVIPAGGGYSIVEGLPIKGTH